MRQRASPNRGAGSPPAGGLPAPPSPACGAAAAASAAPASATPSAGPSASRSPAPAPSARAAPARGARWTREKPSVMSPERSAARRLRPLNNPPLLFLDAAFEALLHLAAPPLGVRRDLVAATLLLFTQVPHLETKRSDFPGFPPGFPPAEGSPHLLQVLLAQLFQLFAVFLQQLHVVLLLLQLLYGLGLDLWSGQVERYGQSRLLSRKLGCMLWDELTCQNCGYEVAFLAFV